MKCTIESIRNIELKNNRIGSRVEGFIPTNMEVIPAHIRKWMGNYEGIKVIPYENGIFVASWAETTCSERDVYNSVRGAHIAESKSKAKIYRFLRNFSQYMSNYFEALSNDYQDAYLKYDHCVEHEEAHTELLSNENNE